MNFSCFWVKNLYVGGLFSGKKDVWMSSFVLFVVAFRPYLQFPRDVFLSCFGLGEKRLFDEEFCEFRFSLLGNEFPSVVLFGKPKMHDILGFWENLSILRCLGGLFSLCLL